MNEMAVITYARVARMEARIKALEEAVRKSWLRKQDEWERGDFSCNVCASAMGYDDSKWPLRHTPDCIVPSLA